jgi:hypothetical protein
MARRFDRPNRHNLNDAVQVVRYHDKFLSGLEDSLDTTDQNVADIAQLVSDLADAVADITAAQAAATAAQTTANTVQRDDSIADSYPVPGNVLTAADVGSDATITIANHNRRYNDGAFPAVTGGTITGLAFNTIYYVYYDQTSRAGGAVTYAATTDAKTALPATAAGRHFVGKVPTPADGGGGTTGGGAPPSGGGGITPDNVF